RASRTRRAPWRAAGPWLALAACLALMISAAVAFRRARAADETGRLADLAFNDTLHERHGGHGPASGELAAVLSQASLRLGGALPVDFSSLRANGCRTVSFAGHDVLEVCFKRDGAWFHCYIANRADFPGLSAKAGMEFAQQARLASASWSDATHHFIVVGEAGLESVKRLL
ncbi:MAG: hypothetical protein JWM88_2864, partial [Verrucomicrobia bacterium]|nr:hypothetical protein [Verrucomicrobiota bacterium]